MSRKVPKRVLAALLRAPWAIQPEWLHTLADVASRALPPWDGKLAPGREAVRARAGTPLKGSARASLLDGVAVIPVVGPIFPHANLLTEMSGATALDDIALDLGLALASADVRAILLDIDSPGGVAFGVHEFAGQVRAASAVKPVAAYVGGLGASAAYWIAAAAPDIVVEETALLGSIGVVMAAQVQEGLDRDGYRQFDIVSSNAPNKRPDLATPEGVAVYRAELDALEAVFVADVARLRGLSPETVTADFGRGGLLAGAAAVAAGMADRVGVFEDALARLGKTAQSTVSMPALPPPSASASQPTLNPEKETPMSDPVPPLAPASVSPASSSLAPVAPPAADPAAAERERISGILAVGAKYPGHDGIVQGCVADPERTANDCKLLILDAKDARAKIAGQGELARMAGELPKSPAPAAPAAATLVEDSSLAGLPIEEKCKRRWAASADLQAEFGGDYSAFVAFAKAEAAGRVRYLRKPEKAA